MGGCCGISITKEQAEESERTQLIIEDESEEDFSLAKSCVTARDLGGDYETINSPDRGVSSNSVMQDDQSNEDQVVSKDQGEQDEETRVRLAELLNTSWDDPSVSPIPSKPDPPSCNTSRVQEESTDGLNTVSTETATTAEYFDAVSQLRKGFDSVSNENESGNESAVTADQGTGYFDAISTASSTSLI